MPIELPTAWVIVLNVVGWPVIHLGVAWVFTRLPGKWFEGAGGSWLRPRGREVNVYKRIAGVRVWKRLLPDGAPWMRGFAKRKLLSTDTEYLRRFIVETWRGEAAHWVMMGAGVVFFLWNPLWADGMMVGYAVAANVPCIVTQRYNRFRLEKLVELKMRKDRLGAVGGVDGRGAWLSTG